jgi:hypothetical protein
MDVVLLISTGMIFRNQNRLQYGIPAYTDPFRALTRIYDSARKRINLRLSEKGKETKTTQCRGL